MLFFQQRRRLVVCLERIPQYGIFVNIFIRAKKFWVMFLHGPVRIWEQTYFGMFR